MTQNKQTKPASGGVTHPALTLWQNATGALGIPMTNDYLFRALLQENNTVLKGLVCSLLHLAPSEVVSAVITNPIELGSAAGDKAFFLDVRILLNNSRFINLEMQVVNEHDWPERSLSYLCRSFDYLKAGEDYIGIKPVMQICFLDFTLFPDHPEFYATYKFINIKNLISYSDKIRLSVLDLTRIDLATEEDRSYGIDHWAALFKATTWEELKALAKDNDYINEASATIFQLSQEDRIRLECEAREDYYRRQRYVESRLSLLERTETALERVETALAEKGSALEKTETALAQKGAALEKAETALAQKGAALEKAETALAQKGSALEKAETALAQKGAALAQRDAVIRKQMDEIDRLRAQLASLSGSDQAPL